MRFLETSPADRMVIGQVTVNATFKAVTVLVRGLGAVCPVTLSRVYMQTCTLLEANVNRVETWAVRLWREAQNVAIRDLIREGDQSTLQTARVFKLEVFAALSRATLSGTLRCMPFNAAIAAICRRSQSFPYVQDLRMPTLILTGSSDIADNQAVAGALVMAIPGAARIVVPDTGHLLYLEKPDLFSSIVIRFLTSHGI